VARTQHHRRVRVVLLVRTDQADDRPLRVILGKLGLDTHDRGIKLVATWLRDAGMEVIYLGPYLEADLVAHVAVQEDADVVGLSFLDGGHVGWCRDLRDHLRRAGRPDLPIVVGGIIPDQDAADLASLGVAAVVTPGTPLSAIVAAVKKVGTEARV
jgi:methylmalonyl-CoA mutase, C-terminal domain